MGIGLTIIPLFAFIAHLIQQQPHYYHSVLSSSQKQQQKHHQQLAMVHIEKRLDELGIILPPPPKAAANYVPVQSSNLNLLFLSGHLPLNNDGSLHTGRIGTLENENNVEYGYIASRQVALNIISSLKNHLGDLDRVEKIIKLFGVVQSTNEFKEQHKVMNGCSDLLTEVFGERGIHARTAIGTNSLPLDATVEVEAIVQIAPPLS